jgi:outer membrane protein OmpA-like peptidoglycan-associated protein
MQKQRPILMTCTALALVFSLNGCAWMSNTMSRAKDGIVALKDRIMPTRNSGEQSAQQAAEAPPADAGASAPAQVAAAGGVAVGGGGGHVIAGTGKPIGNGFGECVNSGFGAGEGHGGCGAASAEVAQTDVPAPVVEAAPMKEQPVVAGSEPPPAAPMPSDSQAAAGSQEPQPIAMEQPSASAMPGSSAQPAPANPPQPPVAAAPPAVEPPMQKPAEKISLSADALFPFAQYSEASMLSEGRARLDELAARIKQMPAGGLQRVLITGHADRLGRMQRKQLISERRAQTVRNYLAKLGVDPSVMSATGKGDTDPLVYCKGAKRTAKLKACLAPNRRVDVAFFGDPEKIAQSR